MDMQHLTYIDRAIIAHDFLNPDIADNYRAAPVAMMAADHTDAAIMKRLEVDRRGNYPNRHAIRASVGLDDVAYDYVRGLIDREQAQL
jgi:hypothetical protein